MTKCFRLSEQSNTHYGGAAP